MAAQPRYFGELQAERVLNPIDGRSRFTSQNFNQIVSCQIAGLRTSLAVRVGEIHATYGFLGIVKEELVGIVLL
jgi:hypothetical protein